MKWLAVMNPRAGLHAREQLQGLGEDLKQHIGADWTWTNGNGAMDQVIRANSHYDGFIAVGGDGTISEVINGLDPRIHALGLIPAGTGNGLARDLNLDTGSAFQAILRPRFAPLDLVVVRYRQRGRWHMRKMITTSAIGYVAEITALSNHPCKRLGNWIYALGAILQPFRQEEFEIRLRLDRQPWWNLTLTNLVIQNTQYAGQFRLFPEARLDDGLVNVLAGRIRPVRQLLEDLGTLTQTYFYEPSLHFPASTVAIELSKPTTLMVDGDLYPGVDAVRYRVLKRVLRCCVAERTKKLPAAVTQPEMGESGSGSTGRRLLSRRQEQQRSQNNRGKARQPCQQR
jgi:diacylglycerol kinase (ATP)